MADTLAKRQASAGRGRGRGAGPGPGGMVLNLSQPAAGTAGALPAGAGAGGRASGSTSGVFGASTGSSGPMLGQPYLNTSAMTGLAQPSLVAARPSQEQQQQQNAARMQQQLEAFGIAALVAPDAEGSSDEVLKAHGFAVDEQVEGKLATFVPRRGLLQCCVTREKTGVISTTQVFRMFLDKSHRFIVSGRKRANKQTSNYLISLSPDDLERKSSNFHGKVRANFTGTDFVMYDDGESAEKATAEHPLRSEIGAVLYDTNIAGTKGPRKMTVVLPRLRDDGSPPEKWQPVNEADGIIAAYRANPDSDRFTVLVNKAPKWNEQLRSYQLNFHGRVSKSSVKNFQLCDRRQPQRVVMQFGKVDDDKFSLDYQAPLNATQAFAIALTAFDNKIACE